jgi:hypothetical protein
MEVLKNGVTPWQLLPVHCCMVLLSPQGIGLPLSHTRHIFTIGEFTTVLTQLHLSFGIDGSQIYVASEYLDRESVSNELATATLSWIVTLSQAFLLDIPQLMLTFVISTYTQALSSHATMQYSTNVGFIRHGDRQQHNSSTTWERPSPPPNQISNLHL